MEFAVFNPEAYRKLVLLLSFEPNCNTDQTGAGRKEWQPPDSRAPWRWQQIGPPGFLPAGRWSLVSVTGSGERRERFQEKVSTLLDPQRPSCAVTPGVTRASRQVLARSCKDWWVM